MFAFELFINASSCPTKKLSQFALQSAEIEVLFSLNPQQHRVFLVFRNFASLLRKKWKHQIAVSVVSREVFSCVSCFRSMFMRRNRTRLLAQTSRD